MAIAAFAAATSYHISGMVRDAQTHEPVPFAAVSATGAAVGVLTDEKGLFDLSVPIATESLQVACLGYEKKVVPIKKGKVNMYDIQLTPTSTQLQEVVVHRKKYKKKGNPAVDFAKKLRSSSGLTDPRRNDFYNYDEHQITTIALTDFGKNEQGKGLFKQFPFLWEHVDTSEISGKPILNLMVKERTSTINYRRDPKSEKELVTGTRQSGIDEMAEQDGVQVFLDNLLGEIDLYVNDIDIMQNRFVSPLSKIAPDFYKFYLTDTVEVDSQKCIVLSFYPHNPATCGFNGQVYVPLGDSTMFIKKVTMHTPRGINLNFVNSLYISQTFDKAPDGSRLKLTDDITMEGNVVKGTPGIYARRSIAYSDHSFTPPADLSVFDGLAPRLVADSADVRSVQFWEEHRIAHVKDNEKKMELIMEKLRQSPLFYWSERTLKLLFQGYVHTGKDSKFDLGPINTFASHNSLEGWRFRVGGMTTANLSKRIFGRGYVAYGTRDRKLKYSGEVEYSFRDKDYHSREFPVHSLRFTTLYDVDHIGQEFRYTSPDNFFLSLRRANSHTETYHRVNKLEYILELENNFSLTAKIENEIQYRSRYVSFVTASGRSYRHYSETGLSVELRYAPGEKYYQTKSYRKPVSLDAPIFTISHKIAPGGILGNTFPISTTEIGFQKRFWFSAWGNIEVVAKGAHVWTSSPFPELSMPNANLSYVSRPESFALMSPMEFIADTNATLFLTYNANGAIFNYIPGIKRLKLREVFRFNAFWGNLSRRNNPEYNHNLPQFPKGVGINTLHGTPYMEAAVGLDNILSVLRIEYVWRLSYRSTADTLGGIRFAMHVAF